MYINERSENKRHSTFIFHNQPISWKFLPVCEGLYVVGEIISRNTLHIREAEDPENGNSKGK